MSEHPDNQWWVSLESQLGDGAGVPPLADNPIPAEPGSIPASNDDQSPSAPAEPEPVTQQPADPHDDSLGDDLVDVDVLAQIERAVETAASRRRARLRTDLSNLNERIHDAGDGYQPTNNGTSLVDALFTDAPVLAGQRAVPGRDAQHIDEEGTPTHQSPFDDRRVHEEQVHEEQPEGTSQDIRESESPTDESGTTVVIDVHSGSASSDDIKAHWTRRTRDALNEVGVGQSEPMDAPADSATEHPHAFVRIPVWYLPWKWWRSLIAKPLSTDELRAIAVEDDDATSATLADRVAANIADVAMLVGGLCSVLIAALGVWTLFQAIVVGFGFVGSASRLAIGETLNHLLGAAQVFVLAPIPVVLARASTPALSPHYSEPDNRAEVLSRLRRAATLVLAMLFGVVLVSLVRACFHASSLTFLDLFLRTATLSIIGVCVLACWRGDGVE